MSMRKQNSTTGSAVLEYTIVFSVVLLAFITMHKYFYRGMAGQWKRAGETFDMKQFSPGKTVECRYSPDMNVWYEVSCYEDCVRGVGESRRFDDPYFVDRCCACCCDGGPDSNGGDQCHEGGPFCNGLSTSEDCPSWCRN